MQLIRAVKILRARHRDGVAPHRAALGDEQVIISAALVDVRPLGETDRGAGKNVFTRADEFALFHRIFLAHDPVETVLARTVIPELIEKVFLPVSVVKKRGIESAAVEINWIGPVAID